jgi:hypothetical protein
MGNPPNICEQPFTPAGSHAEGMAFFRHFLPLARHLQYPWHGAGCSVPVQGERQ